MDRTAAIPLPRRAGMVAAGTGLLAGLALGTARRSAAAARRHPPVGRIIEAGGARVHLLDRGRGNPVVFLHGAGGLIEDMALGLLDRAAERYRAVAFDRPGYGYSTCSGFAATIAGQVRVLRAAMRALGIERPILVGHSAGATVALAHALDHPDELAGVVALAPYCFPTGIPTGRPDFVLPVFAALPLLGPALSATLLPVGLRLGLPAMIAQVFAPNPVPDWFLRRFPGALLLRPRHIRATGGDMVALPLAAAAMASRYRTLAVPLAIVTGDADPVTRPEDHAIRLHEAVPGSTLMLLPGLGHMPHHFRPDSVIAAIDAVAARADIRTREAGPALQRLLRPSP